MEVENSALGGVGVEIAGGDDDRGYLVPIRIAARPSEEVEAVHTRQDRIEEDDVGSALGEALERLSAVRRLGKYDSHTFASARILNRIKNDRDEFVAEIRSRFIDK